METFDDFAGLMKERPALAVSMTVFALSALGLPPFSGLWGKYYVFKAAWEGGAGLGMVAVAALVGSVVAAFYYLKLIKVMWLDPSPGPTDAPAPGAAAITYATAVFAFPVVLVALVLIDPLARSAALDLIRP
jgi:NADH-quinone oxidoreductase subunit N